MKNKKLNLAINIIVGIILVLAVITVVNILISSKKGYTPFFGKAAVAVRTESMVGDYEDSFNKGDVIFVRILNDEEKNEPLAEGTVISYYMTEDNVKIINTHRIAGHHVTGTGQLYYVTKGDNNPITDQADGRPYVFQTEVIGVYEGSRLPVVGHVAIFLSGKTGFFVCVVLPSFLILGYCIFALVKNVRQKNAPETVAEGETSDAIAERLKEEKEMLRRQFEAEKERLRQELLDEFQRSRSDLNQSTTDGGESSLPDTDKSED